MSSISLLRTKNSLFSLKVDNNDSGSKTLHSLYDPAAEARSIVDRFVFNGKGIIVVLGLGLGYHVSELIKRNADVTIIVLESEPDIVDLAMKHGPKIDERVLIITGQSSEEALKTITQHQLNNGYQPVTVFTLSSAVNAFPAYYKPILSSLKKTETVKLWDKLRYQKFKTESLTVLMIDSGYFLLTEADKALRSHDHKVVRVRVQKSDNGDRVITGLMEAIIEFKPDFVLTVNHLGLDEEGIITDFLKSIEMPLASWYVDSPDLIVKAFDRNVSPYIALFMWDRSYINNMKLMGFESVEYLPLATDERVFRPLANRKHKKKLSRYICDVSFVGNSMVEPVGIWMEKVNDNVRPVIDRISTDFVRTGCMMEMLSDDEKQKIYGLSAKEKMDFEAAVIWKATLNYRLACMKGLKKYGLRIYGDKEWEQLFDDRVDIRNPLNYYKELPLLFNACKINFNATSLQMREAVNQRVFDVPACGSFLITDDQESMHDLFEHDKEVVTYKDKDEIPELVKFYLNNPEKRQCIALKGRERVLNNHTYKHRLHTMIEFMVERYK